MSQTKPTQSEANTYATEWLKNGHQSKAWKKTFPKSKAAGNVVRSKSVAFHKLDAVKKAIKKHQKASKGKSEERYAITAEALKQDLYTIARIGMGKDAIPGKKTKGYNLTAAIQAITEINRMDGNHAGVEFPVPGDGTLEIKVTRRVID